jgi:hypothetical protein
MECTSPLPDSTISCSGNGFVCSVPDVGCICNFGWTSLSDFSVDSSGPECLINYRAVRILSYFVIIIPLICSILIGRHYIVLTKRKKLSWEYKNVFPFFFFILGISNALFGVLKLSYQDGQQPLIGRDLSVSLILFFSISFCFTGMVIYLQVIVQFLQGYSRMMSPASRERVAQRFAQVAYYSWFILLAAVIFSMLPLIAIAYPSQSKQICMGHFIGISIATYTWSLIFCNALSFLLKELKVVVGTSKDLQVVVSRLSLARNSFVFLSVAVATLYLVFGCSNLLIHLGTYFSFVIFIVCPPGMYMSVVTVAGVSHNKQVVPSNIPDKISADVPGCLSSTIHDNSNKLETEKNIAGLI